MTKQASNTSVIPANKGRSTEKSRCKRALCTLSIPCVYTHACVCVGRVLPVTHGGSLALRNEAPKQFGKPGVGLELPELHGTRQDRTGRGRAGQWRVRQQETAMSSLGTLHFLYMTQIHFYTHSVSKQAHSHMHS